MATLDTTRCDDELTVARMLAEHEGRLEQFESKLQFLKNWGGEGSERHRVILSRGFPTHSFNWSVEYKSVRGHWHHLANGVLLYDEKDGWEIHG